MEKAKKSSGPRGAIGGTLNILGLSIDLGELLGSTEDITGRLEELREKLKTAGGKEVLSDEEWRRGGVSVSGHIRTRGLLGDREYHIGSMGTSEPRGRSKASVEPVEVMEPPVDVFYEGGGVTIVADVPGVTIEELELKIEGGIFTLTSRKTARRRYHKTIQLEPGLDPGSLQATCRNGVLEARIGRKGADGSQV